ncbi:MAG: hypothetical protein ACJ79R_11385 [Anaeromyxobacteraceae bacterium]
MHKIVRKGQAVYAADGRRLGAVLQCDSSIMIIGQSRWASDHVVVPIEQVAASGPGLVILSAPMDSIRPETAEPWPLPRDPVGNANGVDIEPLRAGMAELEDERVTAASPSGDAMGAPETERTRPDPPLPSPEDAWELERARMARVDADLERRIAEELEDFEIGAGCALPTAEEVPRIGAGRELADRPLPSRTRDASQADGGHDRPGGFAATRTLTRAATEAARGPRALEHFLRSAGFSRAEAKAIAVGGFHALASLVHRYRRAQRADRVKVGAPSPTRH